MELVTGKKPVETEFGENSDIVMWVWSMSKEMNREMIMKSIDPSIEDEHKEDALKVLTIALLCTDKSPQARPFMKSVVSMLEKIELSYNNNGEARYAESANGEITKVV